MIKAEVVFDGDYIYIKDFTISVSGLAVWKDGEQNVDISFTNLGQIIKYCLEN